MWGGSNEGDGVSGTYNGTGGYSGVSGIATTNGTGVYGTTADSEYFGVKGTNTSGGTGVYGTGGRGVYGTASTGTGVSGESTSSGWGTYGISSTGIGVYGVTEGGIGGATGPYGVYGSNSSGDAIHGVFNGSTAASAVAGVNTNKGNGVYGSTGDASYEGISGYTSAATGYSGYFGGGKGVNITGEYYQNGTCVAGCPSDQRLKKNIEPLKDALGTLLQLKGVTYEWKNPEVQGKNQSTTQTGFIAQDVERSFPNWVGDNGQGYKTLIVQPAQIGALEVEAIRTLKTELDAVKGENSSMKDRLDRLETGGNPNRAGFTFGNGGWGVAGLALGLSVVASRRRKEDRS